MPHPVDILLDKNCAINPAWAVFDPGWYLFKYPDVLASGITGDTALAYYLKTGAKRGHAPSPLFDEAWYLARHVEVATLVEAGEYASGFDHFCRFGHRTLSPHWLFDDALYASLYDDMALENLDQHECYGRYDHYLRCGQREHRMAQFLFNGAQYQAAAIAAGVPAAEIDGIGPFVHCLYRLSGNKAELTSSVYFDPAWYLSQNRDAADGIARGVFSSALQHYLCNDEPEHLDPVPEFSEAFYRAQNPDVAQAVEAGFFRSGYQHFIQQGAFELRRPSAAIDLMYYRDMNARVRNDLNLGDVRDAFAHLRMIGLQEGLVHCPPDVAPVANEPAAKQAFRLKARNQLALFARHRLDFTCTGSAAVSVVLVLHNNFELTMLALASLRNNFPGAIELLIIDNASRDESRQIADYVAGARITRLAQNIGFLQASNLAVAQATAPALLFLNNDVELGHAALPLALARLAAQPDIGAVGAKIIRTHGVLQEAGSIIWRDGTTTGYMRDASPLAPEANFVRAVDYCSAVFLLVRTALVQRLGGFDPAFSPAYYEEADLCVRLQQLGRRIVYDPAVTVHHLEFGSANTSEASMALMRRGRRIFCQKHDAYLKTRYKITAKNQAAARAANDPRRRVLFIEDTVPLRRLGSGFVRANDCVRAIAAAGYAVTVFPVNGAPYDVMSLFGQLPDDVEVMHDRDIMSLGAFLAERPGFFDLVWISRTHNLQRVLPILQKAGIDPAKIPFVLDTEAVASLRNLTVAAPADLSKALRREFAGAALCAHVTAVNPRETSLLRGIDLPRVTTLGTIRAPIPTPAAFAARDGLLYVAAFHQQDSPNLDALHWYAKQILPALMREMAQPPMLHVVGYTAPGIDLAVFADHPFITLHGSATDLAPYYAAARLFIAPTRFAAGTPYKLYEAAAYGLPCVVTSLLAGQLGWQDGKELLAAPVDDAKTFARQIAALYQSETVWTGIRKQALKRLAAENTAAAFNETVAEILRAAMPADQAVLKRVTV